MRPASGEKGKEQLDVVHKVVETAPLYTLIGKPVADKQDNRADDKETRHFKDPVQVAEGVFDIQHRDCLLYTSPSPRDS